jgi:hypothetical protein
MRDFADCAAHRAPTSTRKSVRRKTNLRWRFKSITPVQPSREKYSYFFFSEIVSILRRPASARGAYRDRHDTRGGMRWTWLRQVTTGADTDGQVVWLWHPDADAKFATVLTHRADDGGQKARRTGESTKQP